MKKTVSVVLALIVALGCVLGFAACSKDDATEKTDAQYIKDKGTLVVGYTEFAPMNYKNDNGELIGFETDFAKAVAAELGLEVKFQLIEWASKETELKSKNIDCIWNGMTIDDERLQTMSISTPYMSNKQVLVVKADKADAYKGLTVLPAGTKVVAEQKSAGETVITETNKDFFADVEYTALTDQAATLMNVMSGVADCAVVDYVLSIGMIGEGTDYSELVVVDDIGFADEQYGIAFRKDSDFTAEVNAVITKLVGNGKLNEIAAEYKLADLLIAK